MHVPPLRVTLLAATLAAGVALAVAFGFEWFGGLVPCALCLVERWPWRVAIAIGVLGLLVPRPVARMLAWAMVLAVLAGGAAAAVHVGVERQLWPSPLPECAAPRFSGGSIAERLAAMPARPSKACDEPAYPIEALPISFATGNLLYALAVAAFLATFLLRSRRSAP